MLKEGMFITPEATYSIYEIDTNGYRRVDITTHGADFQVDIDAVKYSLVQKKSTFTYGDASLYELLNNVRGKALAAKLITTKENTWENGKFITRVHSVTKNGDICVDTELSNNIKMSERMTVGQYTYYTYVSDLGYDIKLDPINMSEYESSKFSKDSIYTDNPNLPYHSLETLRRKGDYEHIYKNDFVVADTVDLARKRLSEWVLAEVDVKGYDTETTGLDVDIYGEDQIVGIILGETETKSTYFPFRHKGDFNLPIWFEEELLKQVKTQESKLVAHNKKFDRKATLKDRYDIKIRWCTYQISMVLDPQIGKDHPHDLKTLIWNITKLKYPELDEIFLNAKDIDFSLLPKELVHFYACADGSNAIRLYHEQMKQLPKGMRRLVDLECALSDVKADQEFYGIRVDTVRYEKQYHNCLHVRDILIDAFRRLTGEDGNINSGPVLQNLIYNKMKCDILSRTATGLPSTSGAAIKKLAGKQTDTPRPMQKDIVDLEGKVVVKGKDLATAKYPALLILNKYREYNKLITAFYARFERTMKTGRVFFWINQNGAASGRQSSPMHQLPPALKECILCDADDRDFWGPDYSQVELRMIAYLAGEKDLIEMCSDPDNDIHRVIGSLITGKEMWEITPAERTVGKRRNFGVVYKISAYGLAGQLYGPGYTKEQRVFCQEQLDDFYRRFKRIRRFIDRNAEYVQKYGYMQTKWLHRKRMFMEIFDPDLEPKKKASILRMSNNLPVQGTAADLLKLAEVKMYEYIQKKGWDVIMPDGFPMVRMMLSIHDEIIMSVHHEVNYEEIIKMIRDCMELPVDGAPPFFVQPVKMANWGDHASEGLVIPVNLRDKLIEDYERTGVSVMNRETYERIVYDYNTAQLHDYMCDLVAKYGTDYKVVGEHVRHPVLTHSLLGLYEKRISWSLEHVERINEAAKLYIEEKILGATAAPHIVFTASIDDKHDDDAIKESLEVEYGELEDLVNVDQDGHIVFEDNDQQEVDDQWYDDDEDYEEVLASAKNEPQYVYELGDSVMFDTNELTAEDINKVLQYIASISSVDGFYRTFVFYSDRMLDTKMLVENINVKEANDLIRSLLKEDVLCTV